jgi:hypothetical protein
MKSTENILTKKIKGQFYDLPYGQLGLPKRLFSANLKRNSQTSTLKIYSDFTPTTPLAVSPITAKHGIASKQAMHNPDIPLDVLHFATAERKPSKIHLVNRSIESVRSGSL